MSLVPLLQSSLGGGGNKNEISISTSVSKLYFRKTNGLRDDFHISKPHLVYKWTAITDRKSKSFIPVPCRITLVPCKIMHDAITEKFSGHKL